MVLTYFCPWTLNLHIAIVLLRLGVHFTVEIKLYKSRIRILQFEEPLVILITFIKPHCIFVLKKLHFGVYMSEMLSSLVYAKLHCMNESVKLLKCVMPTCIRQIVKIRSNLMMKTLTIHKCVTNVNSCCVNRTELYISLLFLSI